MARKLRYDFSGAWHHVMHRGARRELIFKTEEHCELFLQIVEEAIGKFEVEVHGYSLMPNHYHLLIRSKLGNLSKTMQFINGEYTQRINRLHGWDGPVFRGRFRSELVQDETRLPFVLAYIHLNPLKANLVTRIDSRCWTGHRSYLGRRDAPAWVSTSYFMDLFETASNLQTYILELHRGKRDWPELLDYEWGVFRDNLTDVSNKHQKAVQNVHLLSPGEILSRVAEISGCSKIQLKTAKRGPGANPARRFAVVALRKYTQLTQREVASELKMTVSQVSNVEHRINPKKEPIATWLLELEEIYVN